MQGDAIAFAIEDDGAGTVGSDLMFGLKDLAAVGFDGSDGGIETALAVEIEQ